MEIESVVYQVFYEMLCTEVARQQYKNDKRKFGRPRSRKLWSNFPEAEFLKKFPSDSSDSVEYFYRKADELHPKKKRAGEIDDRSLLSGLLYMASNSSKAVAGTIIGDRRKLKHLYDEFFRNSKAEIERLQADYEVEDKTTITEKTDILPIDPDSFKLVSDLLTSYYENLSNSNYGLAWQQLSYWSRKTKWKDNFECFKRSQTPPQKVEVKSHRQIATDRIQCEIWLEHTFTTYECGELRQFAHWTLESLDDFYERMKETVRKYTSRGHNEINSVPLYKIFQAFPDDCDFISPIRTRKKSQGNWELSLNYKTEKLYNAVCVLEDSWKIESVPSNDFFNYLNQRFR